MTTTTESVASRTPKHYPAAFINSIAEEGTKDEAVGWLQRIWNERCTLELEAADLRERLTKAREEPVGIVGSMPGTSGFTMATFKADDVPVGTKLYTAQPSGVREGMLRAEEVCKDRAEAWGHSDFQQSEISEARKREAEELADYFRAEAEKLPQTHVLVPVDTLILMRKAITRDAPYSNAAIIAYDGLKESHAMLRAAQEGKS